MLPKNIFSIASLNGSKFSLFVFFLLSAAFLVKILPLLLFPIPQFLGSHAADLTFHLTVTELIKRDIKYVGYEPFYPKGFHVLSGLLSVIMPVGLAITLITIAFSLLFVFFSFKLARALSNNDKLVSLLTAFFSIAVTIIVDVPGVPAPVPQNVALALLVMSIYFFVAEKYFLSGIVLGAYSITHLSWPIALVLMGIFFVLNNKISLSSLKEKIFPLLAAFLPIFLIYSFFIQIYKIDFIQSPFTAGLFSNYLGKKFFDSMISPVSFLSITKPPYVILVAIMGLLVARKSFDKNKKFVFAWLVLLFLLSQSYWVADLTFYENSPNSVLFIGSRMPVYMIFPIAFFSGIGLSRLTKHYKKTTVFFLVVFFASSIPNFDLKPDLTQKEFDAIEKLRELPINSVVLIGSEQKENIVALLGLKVFPHKRDTILIQNNFEPIDTNHLDYVLLWWEDENYSIFDLSAETPLVSLPDGKEFPLKQDYNTTTALKNYIIPFMITWRKVVPIMQPLIRIQSTDTGEEVCYPDDQFDSPGEPCSENAKYVLVKAEKRDLIALFDSFDRDLFYNRLVFLYIHGKISIIPEPVFLIGGEEYSMAFFAFSQRWTNLQSKLSEPNLLIGEILAAPLK